MGGAVSQLSRSIVAIDVGILHTCGHCRRRALRPGPITTVEAGDCSSTTGDVVGFFEHGERFDELLCIDLEGVRRFIVVLELPRQPPGE